MALVLAGTASCYGRPRWGDAPRGSHQDRSWDVTTANRNGDWNTPSTAGGRPQTTAVSRPAWSGSNPRGDAVFGGGSYGATSDSRRTTGAVVHDDEYGAGAGWGVGTAVKSPQWTGLHQEPALRSWQPKKSIDNDQEATVYQAGGHRAPQGSGVGVVPSRVRPHHDTAPYNGQHAVDTSFRRQQDGQYGGGSVAQHDPSSYPGSANGQRDAGQWGGRRGWPSAVGQQADEWGVPEWRSGVSAQLQHQAQSTPPTTTVQHELQEEFVRPTFQTTYGRARF